MIATLASEEMALRWLSLLKSAGNRSGQSACFQTEATYYQETISSRVEASSGADPEATISACELCTDPLAQWRSRKHDRAVGCNSAATIYDPMPNDLMIPCRTAMSRLQSPGVVPAALEPQLSRWGTDGLLQTWPLTLCIPITNSFRSDYSSACPSKSRCYSHPICLTAG